MFHFSEGGKNNLLLLMLKTGVWTELQHNSVPRQLRPQTRRAATVEMNLN